VSDAFHARIARLRDRLSIADVIGRAVKLRGRAPKQRGQCPFHGSKSDSFAIDDDSGRARCWGCGWSGDAIQFVQDHYGLTFRESLERLEQTHGLDDLAAAPVARDRRPKERRRDPAGDPVDSAVLGAFIWDNGAADPDALRTYLRARGVPDAALSDARLGNIRFNPHAPIAAWAQNRSPDDMPRAPAMVALIRGPVLDVERRPVEADAEAWPVIGWHVTYLAPDLRDKMRRRARDGGLYPARKMCGRSAGGAVVLGTYSRACDLYNGEGIETVLSGLGLARAGDAACGLALLSLDNMQGRARLWQNGALPLYAVEPDPERLPAFAFRHDGRVVGLVDADMKPLRGPVDRQTGEPRGLPVVDRRGGRVTRRSITGAERAAICAELFVKSWRAAGSRHVMAVRPRMGLDFNDAAREAQS
jgi:DNA primase